MATAPRGILGVVHLRALPGDPHGPHALHDTLSAARNDAIALRDGGVDGIVVENFGSTPFVKGDAANPLPPHQIAAITRAAVEVRDVYDGPLGINCLRNDARAALGIAAVCEASFVRVNVHVGAYVTDQGVIEGQAADTLRTRASLGAESIAILADVLVKHAQPLAPCSAADATADTVLRGLADGVIVTGRATGAPADPELLEEVRDAAAGRPVYVGSGLTPQLAPTIAPLCEGAIVGTYFKREGKLAAPVDAERVKRLCEIVKPHLR